MKVGDLVKYAPVHAELRESGMLGVVIEMNTFLYLERVFIKWNRPRPQGNSRWDYIDELEVVNERR